MTQHTHPDTAASLLRLALQAVTIRAFDWDIVNDRVRRLTSRDAALPPIQSGDDTLEGVAQMVHPEDRAMFRANIAAALSSTDGEYRSQYRMQRGDDEVRWISEVGQVQFDDARRPIRLCGVSHDITDHKRTEERLRTSDARYQHLLASIDQGFSVIEMVYDDQGRAIDYRFLETNAAFERHTGLIDATGRRVRELVPGIEQHWVDIYARVAETGTSERFEQGSLAMARLFRVEAVRVGDPAQGQVALLFSDITERERLNRALQESEARFREMADGLPLIVWVHDAHGAQEFVNTAFCEFFGVAREEMRGGRWQAPTHPDDGGAYVAEFLACSRERRPFHAEVRVRAGDGQWRWLESWARPWFAHDGTFRGHIGTSADITERKTVEQALRDADRNKDEFLATLAHELRNPLAPIHNVALLIEKDPSPEMIANAAGVLRRQVGQMARLLDDLFDVSRLTLRRLTLQTAAVDLRDVVADALEQTRAHLERAEQSVVLDLPEEPVLLHGDRLRLAQALANLLNNAARYNTGPGTVVVRVARRDDCAEVSVKDQGIGIPRQVLNSVFGMLVQGHADHRNTRSGLGIGLTLVKGLVELHGGTVEAHSEGEGMGAEFTVCLPALSDASLPDVAAETPRLPRTDGAQRILIVDDNVDSAESMAILLANCGYDTRTAHDGASALRCAEEFRPVAVLLDMGLPDMSGLEVVQQIRQAAWGRTMRLAALSGWGQESDKQRATAAGCDDHITKPADLAQLQRFLDLVSDTPPNPPPVGA
ncbi:MAG: PAS domain S-box protein [Planctomycetaceae bacterium]|nr:PAS domain S-box protein [Planctomycetaceae bacterium]